MRTIQTSGSEGYTYTHFIDKNYEAIKELQRQYEFKANRTTLVRNYDDTWLLTVEKVEI